jgi:hypothetical protein
MKRLITLAGFILLFNTIASAQVQRMLLAEGFTSTTCPPCATQNPAFDALLKANEDKITSIKYHMNWPSPGNDPMYHHNPVDNGARRTYYNVNAVPQVVINGNLHTGQPNSVNQNLLNNWSAGQPAFDIRMQHRLSVNNDSVYVIMMIRALQDVSGTLVAQIAVIEKEIKFTTAPGSNGEKDFYNVMKALIPSRNGTALPNFLAGEYVIVEAAWKMANVYNINQIAAVGFVQNNVNKQVFQAANSTADAMQPFYATDAAIKRITDGTAINCSGKMQPKATLVNYGSTTLTSAVIDFKVNGQLVHSVTWTGNLNFLQSAEVDAGQIDFSLLATNSLQVEISSVNGGIDEYVANNSKVFNFTQSPNLTGNVTLFILLNNKPWETTWQLTNSAGEIVQSGGPYINPNTTQSIPLNLSGTDCYEFVIFDEGGNGLCCGDGLGYYAVLNSAGTPLFTGQSFGYSERNQLMYGYVGLPENTELSVVMYPNPAKDHFNLDMYLQSTTDITVEVFETTGKRILAKTYDQVPAGFHQSHIALPSQKKGLYLVNVRTNDSTRTFKLKVD